MEVVYVHEATHDASESYGAYRTGLINTSAVYFCRFACVISEGPGSAGRGHFYWAIMQRWSRPAPALFKAPPKPQSKR